MKSSANPPVGQANAIGVRPNPPGRRLLSAADGNAP